jgi:hypothetical protein
MGSRKRDLRYQKFSQGATRFGESVVAYFFSALRSPVAASLCRGTR